MRTLLLAALLLAKPLAAQRLAGRFVGPVPDSVLLFDTRGATHQLLLRSPVSTGGEFAFPASAIPGPGFYQVAVNDTDRADLILDPREQEVVLLFSGRPLQSNITVLRSPENERLWAYKAVSRESQAMKMAADLERVGLRVDDVVRSRQLDSIARQADAIKDAHLDRLIAEHPESYFARVVRADRALLGLQGRPPMDVARAFAFDDEGLMRSAVHPQAVLVFLRNIRAVSEEQFVNAADTLIDLTGACTACRRHMIEHLVEIFATYGPDIALQHLIDRYVDREAGALRFSSGTLEKVTAFQRVSVGRVGPDAPLKDPVTGAVRPLSELARGHRAVVLFFYSSTCDHCHEQMPGLARLYTERSADGVQVIGVALDDDASLIEATRTAKGLTFPCFSHLLGWGDPAARAYAVQGTPTLFVLDGDLRIQAKPRDAAEAREVVLGLLARPER